MARASLWRMGGTLTVERPCKRPLHQVIRSTSALQSHVNSTYPSYDMIRTALYLYSSSQKPVAQFSHEKNIKLEMMNIYETPHQDSSKPSRSLKMREVWPRWQLNVMCYPARDPRAESHQGDLNKIWPLVNNHYISFLLHLWQVTTNTGT